jgi:hypothetical protein
VVDDSVDWLYAGSVTSSLTTTFFTLGTGAYSVAGDSVVSS